MHTESHRFIPLSNKYLPVFPLSCVSPLGTRLAKTGRENGRSSACPGKLRQRGENIWREIHIPYCRETSPLHVEEKNLSAVLTARMHEYDPGQPEAAIVQEALEHPIGTPACASWQKRKKKKVVLVTSDHTRAVPSKLTLPLLLAEIRAGQPDADIPF